MLSISEYQYKTTDLNRTCSDINLIMVTTEYECKLIVPQSLTGLRTQPQPEGEKIEANHPKNCYEIDGVLWWNNHENGSAHPNAGQICRTQGR